MSPSRAGSSHSSSWRIFSSAPSWRIFSSARLGSSPFSLQLGIENWLKNELKFQFSVEDLFSIIKLTKLCIWIKLFTFKNTKVQINDHKIDWNHDTEAKLGNWKNLLLNDVHIQLGFSSETEVLQLGSARLGTFTARARSSQKIPARTHHYQVCFLSMLNSSLWD